MDRQPLTLPYVPFGIRRFRQLKETLINSNKSDERDILPSGPGVQT